MVLQPFADDLSLYEVLTEALAGTSYDRLAIVVAWAKESGLSRIRESLRLFRARGGVASILLGIDEGGATVEGLSAALNDFNSAKVLFDASSGTFHPKLYVASGSEAALVVIGSNNLTAGGLYANYEVSVALFLDLTDNDDRQVFQSVDGFLERLTNDGTVAELTAELLVDLRRDGRFRIDDEQLGWQQKSSQGDSLGADRRPDAGSKIFGSSNFAKKRDPARRRGRHVAPGRRRMVAETPEEGATGAPVVLRWSKKLKPSDCAQPRPGSNTTGALRFTKAGQPIDPARFFRQEMFVEAAWLPDPTRLGRERSEVRFDVVIGGFARGTHTLELKHDSRRAAGQDNFTTDLKWGSLTPVIRQTDLTGKWLSIEKLADGSMRMLIGDSAPTGDVC